MMLLAQAVVHVVWIDDELVSLARDARLGCSASSPAKSRDEGEVLFQSFGGDLRGVAGLKLSRERAMLLPDVLGRARRRLPLWNAVIANGRVRINDVQVRGQPLWENVAIIDLSHCLLRMAVSGWARLARVNAVNDMCVHRGQQADRDVESFPLTLAVVLQLPDSCRCRLISMQAHLILVAKVRCTLAIGSCMLTGSIVQLGLQVIALVNEESPSFFLGCAF